MLIGARQGFTGSAEWENPYVTDGLVAMYDGEWNAGGGKHDARLQGWMNLVTMTLSPYSKKNETPNWQSKSWRSISSTDEKFFEASFPDIRNANTVEVVVSKFTDDRGVIIGSYGMPSSNGVSFERFNSNGYKFRAYYNGNPQLFSDREIFPLNQIKYYAAVQSGDNSRIYNGAGTQVGANTSNARSFTASPARIGTDSRTTTMCWNGEIYAIRIYSRALTTAEIKSNYSIDAARFL